jgi:hypothetical protein
VDVALHDQGSVAVHPEQRAEGGARRATPDDEDIEISLALAHDAPLLGIAMHR